MNKWLYRAVGVAGVASGICLVASGGAAYANETLPAGGTGADQPAAGPQLSGAFGQLLPSLSDLLMTPHAVNGSVPAAAPVVDGDLPRSGAGKAESGVDVPRDLGPRTGDLQVSNLPRDLNLRQEPDNSSGVSQNGVGVLLAAGAGLVGSDDDDKVELLPVSPSTPTATVSRGALGMTALPVSSGRRAENLLALSGAQRVLDQVSVNGAPLNSRQFPDALSLRPTDVHQAAVQQPAAAPVAEPVATTRTGRPSPRPRVGERPVAGVDAEYAR